MPALLAAHPRHEEGTEVRKRLDQHGVQYGPAFTGLAAVRTGEGEAGTVLAEVALPGQIRSQQSAYGVHPTLLDACFQSVEAHPDVQALGGDVLVLPLGIRRLRAFVSDESSFRADFDTYMRTVISRFIDQLESTSS
jgi:polyketide synthase 5